MLGNHGVPILPNAMEAVLVSREYGQDSLFADIGGLLWWHYYEGW